MNVRISDLNAFFGKCGRFQLKHKIPVLAGLLLFTIFALAGLKDANITNNEEEWFSGDARSRELRLSYKEKFGFEDGIYILVEADDVFDYDVLCSMKALGERLEAEVPFVKKVDSIVTQELAIGTEEGITVKSPFEDGIPENAAELAKIKEFMAGRSSFINTLFSSDFTQAFISLTFFDHDGGDDELMCEIGRVARSIIESEEFKNAPCKYTGAGLAYIYNDEVIFADEQTYLCVGFGFLVMVICLSVLLRSVRGVIFPLVATVFGIGIVFGFCGWFKIPINATLMTVPVLLGMALSVGYSIHYINAFNMHFRRSGNRLESVALSVEETFWPLLFTVLTTFASLISFLFAETKPIRWLGGCSAAVVVSSFLYVIVLIPIFLSFGKNKTCEKSAEDSFDGGNLTAFDLKMGKFGQLVIRRSGIIIVVFSIILLISVLGIMKIRVSQSDRETYGTKVKFMKDSMAVADSKIGTYSAYEVMLTFEDCDALKSSYVMKRLEELQDRIGNLPCVKKIEGKSRVTSVLSILKEMNRTMNEDNPEYYCVPDEDEMVSQLLFMYEISGGKDLYDWVDDMYQTTHITVETFVDDTVRYVKDFEKIREYAAELLPEAELNLVGSVVSYAEANSNLVVSAIKSFGFSFIMILIMMILAFASSKIGFIGMLPNISPVFIVAGLIGFADFSLDMYTMTVMPMILGIAVDDTIHFMNHIKMYFEKGFSYEEAVTQSFKEIGKSMLMTTIVLCAMFCMYMISPMTCLFRIGLLSAVGLASALAADYTITPAIIYLTRPWTVRSEKQKSRAVENAEMTQK